MNPVSPTRVIGGRYVVLSELGRGGMGIVWRAEDRVMGRQVAVKELRLPEGLSQQERLLFRERLLREARNAGRLNDPAIVTVHDVVSDAGPDDVVRDHIVMELIEALNLAEVVASGGPLDERSATAVAQQLLSALRAAHDAGVVHRDVKPSNVMLRSGLRVKLTDFGIAQAADDPRLTTTGGLVGSPAYVSPERLEGGPATPASDLWALGATLYFAVQGVGPFQRESTPATISAVLHAEVPPTRLRGPLGTVIAGLLQRSPQARLTGVQAAALLAAPGAPPPAVPDDATMPGTGRLPAAPPAGRSWLRTAGAAALGLGLGLIVGAGGTLLLDLSAGRPEATTLTYGGGGDVPVQEVASEYCLTVQPAPGAFLTYGATVSCEQPHLAEIFAVRDSFDSTRDLAYPGVARLAVLGASTCRVLFDSDLIVGDDKAGLDVVALVPSEGAFTRDDSAAGSTPSFPDRKVYCLLRPAGGGPIEGTRIAGDGS